jgi:hypothetical protein
MPTARCLKLPLPSVLVRAREKAGVDFCTGPNIFPPDPNLVFLRKLLCVAALAGMLAAGWAILKLLEISDGGPIHQAINSRLAVVSL